MLSIFPFLRKKAIFSQQENDAIVAAIGHAELQTSAEIRVFVESKCKYVDALDRAAEIFQHLKMRETKQFNAVLVYVAKDDHQFAIFADHGIHQALGSQFWNTEVRNMSRHFKSMSPATALVEVITEVASALHAQFPYDPLSDENELPNEIVFGK